jgi:tRNA 2-thiouridine synthesizing protein A
MAPGDELTIECTDPLTAIDIPNLLRQTGDTLADKSQADGVLMFKITKK